MRTSLSLRMTRLVAGVGVAAALVAGQVLPSRGADDGVIFSGPSTHRTVALTFDDGYTPARCLEIADILREFGVPATWFPNGAYVRDSPQVWRKIGRHFPIANHTMHHPSLVGLKPARIRDEVLKNERLIEQVTGKPMLHLLRPTFGAYDARVLRTVRKLGYRVVMWNLSTADTSAKATDRGIAKRALSGRPGSIILMHCGPDVTPRILPVVIARYACKGYRFAALDELLAGGPGVAARVTCPPPPLPAASVRRAGPAGSGRAGEGRAGPTDTPPFDPDDPSLARFYEQVPAWQACEQGVAECSSVEVPIDYADPEAGSVAIAVSRVRAAGEARGALVVDAASPGGSGIEALPSLADALSETLLPSFDLVAVDARGTGNSDPISCLDSADLDAYLAADRTPANGAAKPRTLSVGRACARHAQPLAAHMTTVESARDLDIVRAALGEAALRFYGTSSGSLLGLSYAALYPDRVGSMVLDGAIDPTRSYPARLLAGAGRLEQALGDFASGCLSSDGCPLGATRKEVVAAVAGLLVEADADPLPTADPDRPLTRRLLFDGIVASLLSEEAWPKLTADLAAALGGDGGPLLAAADGANGRGPDGFASNARQAAMARQCLDTQLTDDQAAPRLKKFLARSSTFGAVIHEIAQSCEGWPLEPSVGTPDYRATGAAPIVVIGRTRDPDAPFKGARALAEMLGSGVLIKGRGDGSGGYLSGDQCLVGAVNAYYLEGALPEDGLSC